MNKKWIAYSVTGVVGVGLLAGGASAVASSMDLRTGDGQTIPGGPLVGSTESSPAVIESPKVTLSVTDTSVTVVSTVTPTPSPLTPVTPATPVSPVTPATPASPATPPSPASPVSKVSPVSPVSVASAASN